MTAVALIGCGSIGGAVVAALRAGAVPGARHVGTIGRRGVTDAEDAPTTVDAVLTRADLVVEAAGPDALRRWGPQVIAAGPDLLVMSVGALAVDGFGAELDAAGPGRVLVSSGAIGGLDIIGAARRAGALRSVRLTTTKPAAALGIDTDEPVDVFHGGARAAVAAHPRSLNVAAALALAAGSWDIVEVTLRADPAATTNHHEVEVEGEAGCYRIDAQNEPSLTTPTTSGITVGAVLRAIGDRSTAWSFA